MLKELIFADTGKHFAQNIDEGVEFPHIAPPLSFALSFSTDTNPLPPGTANSRMWHTAEITFTVAAFQHRRSRDVIGTLGIAGPLCWNNSSRKANPMHPTDL